MSARGLDELMEQNEAELDFLSSYGGGETPEELVELVTKIASDALKIKQVKDGAKISLKAANLPLVASDIARHGFIKGTLAEDKSSVSVTITAFGEEQKRFIERLTEFIHNE